MVWDVEGRRERVRLAATEEFAERGLSGGSVDRIAATAGVNKERIYSYFGDKQMLFAEVLGHELAELARAVPLAIADVDSLATYAGHVFDYHSEHPHLLRLLYWEALQGVGTPTARPGRSRYYRAKVHVLAEAQAAGLIRSDIDAGQLLCALIALCAWPLGVPQVARMMTRRDLSTASGRRSQRASIVATVQVLAAP